MSDASRELEATLHLKRLIDGAELSHADKMLAERCMRRMAQPLRLTVFGTDPRHALSLVNLMVGQPVVSPSIPRARIQLVHSEEAHARVQYRDGSQERIEGSDFRRLFDDDPARVRLHVNLPVLKKISILVATEADPTALCADIEKTLPPADIALWTGAELSEPLIEAWENVPDRLRDHSYLVLSPDMDFGNWKPIAQEFVEVIRVHPRRAQEAKSQPGGVDKEMFRESGGAQIVKTIKREIDMLTQSALDASDVLLSRYDAVNGPDVDAPAAFPHARTKTKPADPDAQEAQELSARDQVYSVPLGKLASRSRLLGNSGAANSAPKPRSVSVAIKNMPKTPTRPASKVGTKPRVRSRKSGPAATPWSLGL
ncbi:MAG: hypothetical protein AAFR73_08635 [Pseudomonadota bacterium]